VCAGTHECYVYTSYMVQGTSSQISRSHIADRGSRYGPPDRWEEGVGEGHPNQRAPNAWLQLFAWPGIALVST